MYANLVHPLLIAWIQQKNAQFLINVLNVLIVLPVQHQKYATLEYVLSVFPVILLVEHQNPAVLHSNVQVLAQWYQIHALPHSANACLIWWIQQKDFVWNALTILIALLLIITVKKINACETDVWITLI